jgi:hypothetical protein
MEMTTDNVAKWQKVREKLTIANIKEIRIR